MIALDPADLTLLVIIGTTEDGKPRGEDDVATHHEMQLRWPSEPDLLDPALGLLEQQGLIGGADADKRGLTKFWLLRPYGQQFLRHLLTDLGGWPPHVQHQSRSG